MYIKHRGGACSERQGTTKQEVAAWERPAGDHPRPSEAPVNTAASIPREGCHLLGLFILAVEGGGENADAGNLTPFAVGGSSNAGGVSECAFPGPSDQPPKLTRPSPRPLLLSPCQNKAAACGLGSGAPSTSTSSWRLQSA